MPPAALAVGMDLAAEGGVEGAEVTVGVGVRIHGSGADPVDQVPRRVLPHDGVIKAWAKGVSVDEGGGAVHQLRTIAGFPFAHTHTAATPEVHSGGGAPVGPVIQTNPAIFPAAVGAEFGRSLIHI